MHVISGTSAYKTEYITEQPQVKTTRKISSKSAARAKQNLVHLVTLLAVFSIAIIICSRYVYIYGQNETIQGLKKELKDKQTANTQLELNIEQSVDTKSIEDFAENELNMQKPERYQTNYVIVSGDDEMMHDNKADTGDEGILGVFTGIVRALTWNN
ncbi:MAG: hypothetical protein PHE51_00760 [Eubacteriales bacterium]|nr:hypothetical protein [Eubacteriales bacterium]